MVLLEDTPTAVLICTEELFAAFDSEKARLDTAELVAWRVAAEAGGQDLTDIEDATGVACWGAEQVRVQPGLMHSLGDDRKETEMEVQQRHRRTGLKNDACSFRS